MTQIESLCPIYPIAQITRRTRLLKIFETITLGQQNTAVKVINVKTFITFLTVINAYFLKYPCSAR